MAKRKKASLEMIQFHKDKVTHYSQEGRNYYKTVGNRKTKITKAQFTKVISSLDKLWTPLVVSSDSRTGKELLDEGMKRSFGGKKKMAKKRTAKKKSTAKKWKKLSTTAVNSAARKYAKSRSAKRWPSLMKKYGMKQAQRIVKASKKYTTKPKAKSTKKRGSRKQQRPVPQHMRQVSGKRTPPFVFPGRKAFPIGTLAYAKKAIDRLSWPNEGGNAREVMKSVQKRYPTYNWPAYWNDLKKRAKISKKLKTWGQYTR